MTELTELIDHLNSYIYLKRITESPIKCNTRPAIVQKKRSFFFGIQFLRSKDNEEMDKLII